MGHCEMETPRTHTPINPKRDWSYYVRRIHLPIRVISIRMDPTKVLGSNLCCLSTIQMQKNQFQFSLAENVSRVLHVTLE